MLEFPSFPFLLFPFLIFILFKFIQKTKPHNQLPPGPPRLPIIGNLHQLAGPVLAHIRLNQLAKKYGPIMHLKMGEITAIVISSPKVAKEILKTNELFFVQRPDVLAVEIMSYDHSSLVFSPYGDYWRNIRKLCVIELLSTKRVQSFRSIREEEVQNLIESISFSSVKSINLTQKIFSLTNGITSRAAFGKKCDVGDDFISLLKQIVLLASGLSACDLFPSIKILRYITGMRPALEKIHRQIDKILEDILSDHMKKRKTVDASNGSLNEEVKEDLIDVLLELQEQGGLGFHLTNDKIKAIAMDMFAAGSETSATTMEWTMIELLRNPRVMKKAQAEIRQIFKGKSKITDTDIQQLHYLKLVIRETLRLHAPGPLLPREAIENCKINGYKIPKGAKVLINVWALGRDSEYWVNPECFEPERFDYLSVDFKGNSFELLPFGSGKRICPGISFASATMELCLAQLLYHFDWKLPNGMQPNKLDMTQTLGLTCRRRDDLFAVPSVFIPMDE